MQNIKLKDFQINIVNQLLDATSIGTKKEVLLSAPTGSGKTIILLSYIEEFFKENKKTIFVWLTPGKGELEEQSRNKMRKLLPTYDTQNIQDVLLQGFEDNSVSFINWETITKKGNTALKDAERKNLYERIVEVQNKGYDFIVIIDEEHLNKTIKAEAIVDYMNPKYIIRTSATPKRNDEAEHIDVNELDVINSGLITRALYINENVSNEKVLTNENEYLINLAIEKRKLIKDEYVKNNIQVNPMIIIQVPSKSDALIEQIEKILEDKKYSYDRNNLAIWLSERKENIDNITDNEAQPAVLIMKQAISTGWDCPRAKILVKLRDNMSEDFETQTIGRIRRMPQGHHYENMLLDNCYLYTFDEKYEETVKQELGHNAADVKVVFLKKEHKDFSLKKITIDSDFDGFDERQTFNIIYDYFKNKYKLSGKKKDNQTILESNNYSFDKNVKNYIVQGKFVKLEDIKDGERIKVESKVDTHKNGFELRQAINEISSRIGLRYDRTRLILERMFETSKGYGKRFLDLKIVEFYAFVINNVDELKHDFTEAVSQKERQMKLKLENVKESKWQIPEEDYIKYDPKAKDSFIYTKEVYMEYPSSVLKSKSERMFENYCEKSDSVKDSFIKMLPKYKDKVLVQWNIVDINKNNYKYPKLTGKYKILFVGRLCSAKRVDKLIEVHKKLIDNNMDITTYIVGDGELKKQLTELAKELKVTNTLKFLGKQNNILEIMKQADLFVLPSDYEGFGIVLLESLHSNLPFVGTNVCGIKDVAKKIAPKGSYLIAENNVEDIYNKIVDAKNGKVSKDFKFSLEEYNKKCMKDFYQKIK